MTSDALQALLGWSLVINYGFLMLWFLFFTLGQQWMLALHRQWFKLTVEQFDAANELCVGFYKIGIILLNLRPYVALKFFI